MRRIEKTGGSSLIIGDLPRGCSLCMEGAKMVLFITGRCNTKCYYCPISEERMGKDVIYANERVVKRLSEILIEAESMNAKGTGITGGEPLTVMRRTLNAIKLLKEAFGKSHHIHLYTNAILLNRRRARSLKEAGLDEIRIHPTRNEDLAKIKIAIEEGLDAGVEIPVIPGRGEWIRRIILFLDRVGASFINLNELEFSPTNALSLKLRGMNVKSPGDVAVSGSEEEALKILKWASKNTFKVNIHYCPARLKIDVQFKNRLIRQCRNVAKKYESISPEGLLLKGVVEVKGDLKRLINFMRHNLNICESDFHVDERLKRIETTVENAERLASLKLPVEAKIFIVEEYPTSNRLKVSKIPL